MSDIETRLVSIPDERPSANWDDVERRTRALASARRRRRSFATALAFAIALLVAVPAFGFRDWLEGVLAVSRSDEPLPRAGVPEASIPAYVDGDRLVLPGRAPLRLQATLLASLLGNGVPLAFASPRNRFVVYHTWDKPTETPILRLVELDSGRDSILAKGAQSAAWSSDGAIAYTRGTPPQYRPQHPWLGHVVVRRTLRSPEAVWTSQPGLYRVAGWAGSRLLVESSVSNVERIAAPEGTLIFDGPESFRITGPGEVSAISPRGRFFFGRIPRGDGTSDLVRVVDASTGRTVVRAHLQALAREAGLEANGLNASVGTSGSWRGDYIAAVASYKSTSRLVVLRFADGRLTLERILRLDGSAGLHGRYGVFFYNPRLLDSDGKRVVVRADVVNRDENAVSYLLTCDVRARSCVRGRGAQGRHWLGLVEPAPRSR